jgi:hypothetical protein
MPIANFPTALQPAIQEGYLEREFRTGLRSSTVYRSVADPELFPSNVGETVTKTRKGLKAPVTTPLNPSTNTNLDNGLTPSGWTVEQYTLGVDMYGDTIDLNMVTQNVGIQGQFLHNAYTNAVQAGQSLDRLARGTLLNAHMGGHSRVTETLSSPGTTVKVDDVRGFMQIPLNGVLVDVADSDGRRLSVQIGDGTYEVVGYAIDGSNTSSIAAIGGKSGTITTKTNTSVANGTLNQPVISSLAATVLRPNGRSTTKKLSATDLFTMGIVLDGVVQLRNNGVPTVDGLYNCYLDNVSARQLFADPDFKLLYQGKNAAEEFKQARVIELLDVRFLPTTEAVQQALANEASAAINVHRPIICGQGCLVEGVFADTAYTDLVQNPNSLVDVIEGIAMVTRPPLDRLGQIIAQSWYAIVGYVCPTDVTATTTIIPTASSAMHKRAVLIEHA